MNLEGLEAARSGAQHTKEQEALQEQGGLVTLRCLLPSGEEVVHRRVMLQGFETSSRRMSWVRWVCPSNCMFSAMCHDLLLLLHLQVPSWSNCCVCEACH